MTRPDFIKYFLEKFGSYHYYSLKERDEAMAVSESLSTSGVYTYGYVSSVGIIGLIP